MPYTSDVSHITDTMFLKALVLVAVATVVSAGVGGSK